MYLQFYFLHLFEVNNAIYPSISQWCVGEELPVCREHSVTLKKGLKNRLVDGWARFARIKGLDEHTFTFDSRVPRRSVFYPILLTCFLILFSMSPSAQCTRVIPPRRNIHSGWWYQSYHDHICRVLDFAYHA